jgi:response regulator RpfG family c-di-GMP phosphodiesterase
MNNNHHMYKMLIADDDEGSLNTLRLEFRGDYMVLLARDSNEALEELFKPENNDITIIIADKKMPKASGLDFLRETKEKFPHAIRVMITAYPDINDVEELINDIGIDLLYYKPLTDDKVEKLKRGLKKSLVEYELNIEKDYWYNECKKDRARKS